MTRAKSAQRTPGRASAHDGRRRGAAASKRKAPPEPARLTRPEVARALGVSERTARRMAGDPSCPLGPGERIKRTLYWTAESVEDARLWRVESGLDAASGEPRAPGRKKTETATGAATRTRPAKGAAPVGRSPDAKKPSSAKATRSTRAAATAPSARPAAESGKTEARKPAAERKPETATKPKTARKPSTAHKPEAERATAAPSRTATPTRTAAPRKTATSRKAAARAGTAEKQPVAPRGASSSRRRTPKPPAAAITSPPIELDHETLAALLPLLGIDPRIVPVHKRASLLRQAGEALGRHLGIALDAARQEAGLRPHEPWAALSSLNRYEKSALDRSARIAEELVPARRPAEIVVLRRA